MDPLTASISDTAKALGISRTSVYALIREDRLKKVKLGRRALVTTESIRELVASISEEQGGAEQS